MSSNNVYVESKHTDVDDSEAIEAFLSKNKNREVIVVQGLGFVGTAMAVVCANASQGKYAVIGVDIPSAASREKIDKINSGICPIKAADPKLTELFDSAAEQGNLYATCNTSAYSHANTIIVDVNLDVDKNSGSQGEIVDFSVDIEPFSQAIRTIGNHCREDVLVLVETTVPPGSCSLVVHPILKELLAKRNLSTDKFAVGHSYERVMPGPNYIDSIINFFRVYSGIDIDSADRTEQFLRTVINTNSYPLTRLDNTTATEIAKVLENSYRAMNIAFIEEWSRFAENAGVNLNEVIHAIKQRPTHNNMMFPGIGVGGYCLTKDPLLASWANASNFGSTSELQFSIDAVEKNDKTPYALAKRFMSQISRPLSELNVLMLGVSYRGEVGDTRYSPVEPFYRTLVSGGANVMLHDPFVEHWDEVDGDVDFDFSKLNDSKFDVLVISTAHNDYRNNELFLKWLIEQKKLFIFDAVGLLTEAQINALMKFNTVKVVGRGDLS